MLINYNVNSLEVGNISHSVTIVPRLEYSVNLLDDVIKILDDKQNELKKSNKDLILDFDESDKIHVSAMKLEYLVKFSLEILLQVKKNVMQIYIVGSIPEVLPSSIPMIRTVSAKLFEVFPKCSHKLS